MPNVQENIILTHWAGSEDREILVNPSLCKYVEQYHLLQLRFLYSRYKNKFKGIILNPSQDMVCPIAVSAFLSTIPKLENPVLVLSSEYNLKYWRYFLSLIPQANLQINCSKKEHETKANNLLILLGTSRELLHAYEKFSIIIIDNIDSFISTRTKRAAFNIGITYRNFYKDSDDQLLWSILNWSNIYFVGNYETFTEKYNEFLKNYVEPYPSIFLRTTWEYCNSFTKINLKELQNEINNNFGSSDSDSDENMSRNNNKKRKNNVKNKQSLKKGRQSNKRTITNHSKKKTTIPYNQKFLDKNSKEQNFLEGSSVKNIQVDHSDTSNEIIDPKTPEFKSTLEYVDLLDTSSLNLLLNANEIIKQKIPSSQSSDDATYNNSVLGQIIDSPIKNHPVQFNSMELLEKDLSLFENSNILSQMFDDPYQKCRQNSVLDNILDTKLSALAENPSFVSDSSESDGESVLSKLFEI